MARKTPKIHVLLSINKTTFFKTSETKLEAIYGTRKHDFSRDSSYFELKNSSLEGFSEISSFLDFEHFGKAARQNFSPFKFTHFPPFKWFFQCVLFIGYQIWLERRSSGSSRVSVLYFRSRSYNSAQASTLGEKISRFRPVDPPTNDTHDGTELKKLIPAWGA